MSQRNVERVIGRLATDEGFRRRFAADPDATLRDLVGGGLELNACERHALAAVDPGCIDRFAAELDARLQKIEIEGDTP